MGGGGGGGLPDAGERERVDCLSGSACGWGRRLPFCCLLVLVLLWLLLLLLWLLLLLLFLFCPRVIRSAFSYVADLQPFFMVMRARTLIHTGSCLRLLLAHVFHMRNCSSFFFRPNARVVIVPDVFGLRLRHVKSCIRVLVTAKFPICLLPITTHAQYWPVGIRRALAFFFFAC
ncbi:unnamed protein product [Ectocarpus sp. 12 AP-2014]